MWEEAAGNPAGEVTQVLPHGTRKEDTVRHNGASQTAIRAVAGLEKPVGFAQRWLSRLFAQAAEKSQVP